MRIPKIYFFAREAQILEEGWPENLEKMAKNRETYCYANIGEIHYHKENITNGGKQI